MMWTALAKRLFVAINITITVIVSLSSWGVVSDRQDHPRQHGPPSGRAPVRSAPGCARDCRRGRSRREVELKTAERFVRADSASCANSDPLDDRGDTLPLADAHRNEGRLLVEALELVHHLPDEHRTVGAQRMAEGDNPSFPFPPRPTPADLPHCLQ